MTLSFVLVEPARATNVGAAARAIKTMGFNQLIIVNSNLNHTNEAHWVAHGSTDILDNTLIFDNLEQVRAQFDLLIGTTARERGSAKEYLSPDKLLPIIDSHNAKNIAIVFGREASGLTNDELNLCDLYSYVPILNSYPSMNLAQSVMVYSYALSNVNRSIGLQHTHAPEAQLQVLKTKAQKLLNSLELKGNDKLHSWVMDSLAKLGERDCKMAHQLINDLQKKL